MKIIHLFILIIFLNIVLISVCAQSGDTSDTYLGAGDILLAKTKNEHGWNKENLSMKEAEELLTSAYVNYTKAHDSGEIDNVKYAIKLSEIAKMLDWYSKANNKARLEIGENYFLYGIDLFQNLLKSSITVPRYIDAISPWDYGGDRESMCASLMWSIVNGQYKIGQFPIKNNIFKEFNDEINEKSGKSGYDIIPLWTDLFFLAYVAGDDVIMMQSSAANKDPLSKLIMAIYLDDSENIKNNLKEIIDYGHYWSRNRHPSLNEYNIRYSFMLNAAAITKSDGKTYSKIADSIFSESDLNHSEKIALTWVPYYLDACMLAGDDVRYHEGVLLLYKNFKWDINNLISVIMSSKYTQQSANLILANLATEVGDYDIAKSCYENAGRKDGLVNVAEKMMDSAKYDEAFKTYLESGLDQKDAYQAQAQYFIRNGNFAFAGVYLKKLA